MENTEASKEKKRKRAKKSEYGMAETLDDAIEKIREKLMDPEMKGSIGDLVRLLQLRQEFTDTQPRQVTVRWVDECQTTPATDE